MNTTLTKNNAKHQNRRDIDNFMPPTPKGGWSWRTLSRDSFHVTTQSGKGVPQQGKSFGDVFPDDSKEFYFDWNNGTTPYDFRSYSRVVVFWKCKNEHIYPCSFGHRAIGNGCPICDGQRPSKERNLKSLFPTIAGQWHPTLNGKWLPEDFSPKSDAYAAWLCPDNPEHTFISQIKHRTYSNTGCTICRKQSSKAELRLLAELSSIFGKLQVHHRLKLHGREIDLVVYYDENKRACIEFDGAYFHKENSEKDDIKYSYLKKHGETVIRLRGKGLVCNKPYDVPVSYDEECNALQVLVNKSIEKLIDVIPVDNHYHDRLIEYYCNNKTENENDYQESLKSINKPKRGESLLDKTPSIQRIWSNKNARQPQDIHAGCNEYFYLKCDKCGHEWKAMANNLSKGKGCRRCYNVITSDRLKTCSLKNSILTKYPQLIMQQWDYKRNKDIVPETTAVASNHIAWWKCVSCGKPFQQMVQTRVKSYLKSMQSGCLECYGFGVVYVFQNIKTGEQVEASNVEMVSKYGLSAGSLSLVARSNRRSHKGWVCLGKRGEIQKDISSFSLTTQGNKYSFFNLDTEETFTGTQNELIAKYRLLQSDVSAICRGKFTSTRNWVCLESLKKKHIQLSSLKRRTLGDIHVFENITTREKVSGTLSEIAKSYGLDRFGLSFLISGKIKRHKKTWKYLGRIK
jgi:very-short-patch-repair endonuclease